jgi:putative phosphoribosyl transferase
MGFETREEAGWKLGQCLKELNLEDPVILALPRGGVPVAAQVARVLNAPVDLLMVRKIGVPWQRELAAAAIVDGEQHDLVLNEGVMQGLGLKLNDIEPQIREQLAEIERRRALYLAGRTPLKVTGKTVIVIDDGIATGTTVRAGLTALRRRRPKHLVLAVPVAPPDTVELLRSDVDDLVCLEQPTPFGAIGMFYRDFHQVDDEEVIKRLSEASTYGSA